MPRPVWRTRLQGWLLVLSMGACAMLTSPASAQIAPPSGPKPPEEKCIQPIAGLKPPVIPVKLAQGQVRLTFVGHSTFLIETPGGVSAATDYNDYIRPTSIPDIATMNRAHTTHYTDFPDPAIKHVLRGWNPEGGAARHDLRHGDMRVRNVPTNIRDWSGGTIVFGNSMFVFEAADLCIVHLGHLHHTLTAQQLIAIGQPDVILVPVDGSYTLDLEGTVEVLKTLKAPLMIPMHYFGPSTLQRFLERVGADFEVKRSDDPTIVVSKPTLPKTQTVLVLPGR